MVDFVRRALIQSTLVGSAGAALPLEAWAASAGGGLVAPEDFPSVAGITYLDAAHKHPLNIHAAKALRDYADRNLMVADGGVVSSGGPEDDAVLAGFARLINAAPAEIGFAPSTMAAENMIVAALGFPGTKGGIVTDDLHYDGSVYLYEQMRKRGVDVRRIGQKGGRVDTDAIVRAIDGGTKLVAISLVSYANGFQHDLPAICAAAHAKGALVYADIIQAAGAVPIDVKASGVDFAAASTHKWLMGDKGLGFIYMREGLIGDPRFTRPVHGWKQTRGHGGFAFFNENSGRPAPAQFNIVPGAAGQFETGTYALGPMAAVGASLPYIERIGVQRIADHAAALAEPLRAALPKLGYECLSPLGAPGHISAFRLSDRAATAAKLNRAKVKVQLSDDWMRVSISVFNRPADIEAITRALA